MNSEERLRLRWETEAEVDVIEEVILALQEDVELPVLSTSVPGDQHLFYLNNNEQIPENNFKILFFFLDNFKKNNFAKLYSEIRVIFNQAKESKDRKVRSSETGEGLED